MRRCSVTTASTMMAAIGRQPVVRNTRAAILPSEIVLRVSTERRPGSYRCCVERRYQACGRNGQSVRVSRYVRKSYTSPTYTCHALPGTRTSGDLLARSELRPASTTPSLSVSQAEGTRGGMRPGVREAPVTGLTDETHYMSAQMRSDSGEKCRIATTDASTHRRAGGDHPFRRTPRLAG